MAKKQFLLTLFLSLFFLSTPVAHSQTSFKFSNKTAYLTEALTHTSPNPGTDLHVLGWFLNNSILEIGENHSFNLGLMVTHGSQPSADIVGDLQTFSNLESDFLYGFNEVYYQYQIDNFWLKIGQQDINSDFLFTENGLLFTHSSFGIDPVATVNMPAPTFPVTALSITAGIDINANLHLNLGVFDGQFAEPKNDFLGINWSQSKAEGYIYIVEPEFKLFDGKLSQKVGFYHHSGQFVNRETLALQTGLSAFYLISDLQFFQRGEKSGNFFFQFDKSTKVISDLKYYYGFGFKFDNLIKSDKLNELGIGLGHARLNNEFASVAADYSIKQETFIEINYKQEVKDWLSIQPYFQWIDINTAASNPKNPIILALRAYIEF